MTMKYPTATRRDFVQGTTLAGLGAGVLAGDAAIKFYDGPQTELPIGASVVDIKDPTPDSAIVLLSPAVPIRDWWVNDAETVADHNPEFNPNERVVIVAFEHHLSDVSNRLSPGNLFREVVDRGIKFYAFPSSRLRLI